MDTRLQQIEGAMLAFEQKLQEVLRGGSGGNPVETAAVSLIENLFVFFKTQVMEELKSMRAQLSTQGEHLDRLEAYSRRTCLLVHGIPEDQGGSEEQCMETASKIFKDKLDVHVPTGRIERAHRLGPRRQDAIRPRPVIVKFMSYQDKRSVFMNKRKLKGQNISVTESLTKPQLDILKRARDRFQKENVWTSDGKIVVKTLVQGNTKFTTLTTHRDLEAMAASSAPAGLHPNITYNRPRS